MIKHCLAIAFCLIASLSYSQPLQTAYSAPFDEPEELETKVFQCNNGNTLLFNFTAKDGISVDVYDTTRRKIGHTDLKSEMWNPRIMKKSEVKGIYNMGNSVVVFLEQLDNRKPVLYRLVLSPVTGRALKQNKVIEMESYGLGAGYTMAFGGIGEKSFNVVMSPNADAYGIVAFDPFASETAKRILVLHYDSSHNEIGRSYFDNTTEGHKYINYVGMIVNGQDEVVVCSYGYNTAASGGKSSRLSFSKLQGKIISHHTLEIMQDMKNTSAVFSFNTKLNRYELLTLTKANSKGSTTYYSSALVAIRPGDLNIIYASPLDTRPASAYRESHYSAGRGEYGGMPIGVYTNPDGSNTVVMEETSTLTNSHGGGYTTLGDIGVIDYNAQGEAERGYVVCKDQQSRLGVGFLSLNAAHDSRLNFEQIPGLGGNAKPGFYSFDYYGTPAGRYVIFNDHPDNLDADNKSRRKTLSTVSEANAVCYRLGNGEMSRLNLFGAKTNQFDNRFAYLASGNYSEQTGDYAVMIIERQGREKKARIAWVHLN